MASEEDCKCLRIDGHLEAVKWMLWRNEYKPSPGVLAVADWTHHYFHWLHYVESSSGLLPDDDVLQTTNTRYWSIHDPQRYFLMDLHCEQVLFTQQYPNLRMRTRHGNHIWKDNTASKFPRFFPYHKEFLLSMDVTIKKMEMNKDQVDRLIISNQLIMVSRLDFYKRKTFFRILENILSFQENLQLVSLENLACLRMEGVRLVEKLATFNAQTLKYLFLWGFVLPNENPILINYSYITGSGLNIERLNTRKCFLRSLGMMKNLRVLSLEYSYIADGTGAALISLFPILRRPHFRLQLMCRESQIPGYTNAALGAGGFDIPDTAWRRVSVACPDLYVLMVFRERCSVYNGLINHACKVFGDLAVPYTQYNINRVRDYDDVRRFLTPSIPMHEVHLQFGIDLKMKQRQDSDISCFVRHIAYQYASTLNAVSIHQWRFAIFPLRRVFELMPFLTRFFYVGRVLDDIDLRRMLQIVACGVCHKLKHLKLQIQDEGNSQEYWGKVVDSLTEEYKDVMDLLQINFCLSVYKS